MFRPLSIFLGLRYLRAKRRNHFISFISMTSMIGIALGVLVLITVLSVMNGFDKEIKNRVFSVMPALTITGVDGKIQDWQSLENSLSQNKTITAIAPFVSGQALLANGNFVHPVSVVGILPDQEKKMSALSSKTLEGSLDALLPGKFGIALGEDLAGQLAVGVGDKIAVFTSQFSVSIAGVIPRIKLFTVVAVFRTSAGFHVDSDLAFIQLQDAQRLFQTGEAVTGLHVNIHNIYQAPLFANELAEHLPPTIRIANWTDQVGTYFQAVNMEKHMMFLILMLIIIVAVFNLVSTLVMVVNEKEADIAILRTFGATPRMILLTFIFQGGIIGVIGTVLGVIGGIALASHVTEVVNWLQAVLHVQFLSSSVYILDYLPSELLLSDVLEIVACALIFSLLATLYPAYRASRTEPVEALRYE